MAQKAHVTTIATAFGTVRLMRYATLGTGAYGQVCKATLDGKPCAAKLLHPILVDPNNPRNLRKFEQECRFLSEIRHPNIVQCLGVARDGETGLPVLLMELMDDSLTHFLEQSEEPLAYHVQVNISHDIALAVAFLHSKHIIHRDLSGNNVLLSDDGSRAKVTDFGMSKLDSHMTGLTKCPGTQAYMAPEALLDPPVYTEKLDCFQLGVLMIQIITRKFPDPGPAMKRVRDSRNPMRWIITPVPEVHRRQNHLDLVPRTHPMLYLIVDCMKDMDNERPSAQQICQDLSALKEREQKIQQLRQDYQKREREVREQEKEIEDLKTQLKQKEREVRKMERDKEMDVREKEREMERLMNKVREREGSVKDREIKSPQETSESKGCSLRPTPKPRTWVKTQSASPVSEQIHTAPVAGMETMSISDPATVSCFICRGSSVDAGGSYSLCPRHAQIMTQHFMNVPNTAQEPEVKRKPQHPPYQQQQTPYYSSVNRPMENSTPHVQPGYSTQPQSTLGTGHGPAPHAGQVHSSDVRYTAANSGNPAGVQSAGLTPVQHYPKASGAMNDLDTHTAGSGVFAHPAGQHAAGYGGSGGRGTAGAFGGGYGMNVGASPIISGGGGGGGGATGGSGIIQATKAANQDATGLNATGGAKMLCRTAGCSFYPERHLENFCRNCYEEYYGVQLTS